jgi:tRNA threonylcarbamoyladenosine biosynthesis protein TsaE
MQELHLTSLPLSLTTTSPEETEAVGAALARLLESDRKAPAFIAMYGDLGVGKTAFVRGLASVLAPGRAVRSPTFALVNEYRVAGKRPLFHFDMYRIESEDDLFSIGFEDYPDAGICVAEWCENIPFALPDRYLEVRIEKCPPNVDQRAIHIAVKEAPLC